jgi:hypothetical protein
VTTKRLLRDKEIHDIDPQSDTTLRAFEQGETRMKVRRAVEADRKEVEFKPCQNVIDYQLPFKISSVKNYNSAIEPGYVRRHTQ